MIHLLHEVLSGAIHVLQSVRQIGISQIAVRWDPRGRSALSIILQYDFIHKVAIETVVVDSLLCTPYYHHT